VSPQQAGNSRAAAPSGLETQFKARRVTYNRPPEKLALSKPVDVSLVVNATNDEAAGREALEGFKGEIVERDVELSDTVSAQLTGVGFDITSQTVERNRPIAPALLCRTICDRARGSGDVLSDVLKDVIRQGSAIRQPACGQVRRPWASSSREEDRRAG
jgi:hypothetical protein